MVKQRQIYYYKAEQGIMSQDTIWGVPITLPDNLMVKSVLLNNPVRLTQRHIPIESNRY